MNELSIPLHDYQVAVKDFIKMHPYCGIFLDMGMGKTLATLSALVELRPKGHILVIAPKAIAMATWEDEIKDWGIPARTVSLLVNDNGKDLSRKKRLERYENIYKERASMYFINREKISDLVKYVTDNHLPWPFPTVVIDEMQSFKSQKSARFKALKKVRPQISRLIGLSGTPAPNGLLDLWSQVWLMDMGERLGKTERYYKDVYFNVTRYHDGYAVDWEPKEIMPKLSFPQWLAPAYNLSMSKYERLPEGNKNTIRWYYSQYVSGPMETKSAEEVIYERISDICISMKNSDELKLPDLIMQDIFIKMNKEERALYQELKEKSVLEFSEDEEVVAKNAAVLSAKLLQLASGTIYTDDETVTDGYRVYREVHTKKIEMCNYIVDNTSSPVMIAYHFRSDAKRLLENIDGAVLFDKTPQMIHDWNDGKIKVLLVQPASAGHGLNFQKGPGHTLIWFTIPWSLEEYEQMNKRLHRQGQKNNVTVYRLFTKGTMDIRVKDALEGKAMTQNNLLSAIEAEIERSGDDE